MKFRLYFALTIIGIFILPLTKIQTSELVSPNEEINLNTAIKTALLQNPTLKIIQEKVNVAQAELDGIALFSNPILESEFIDGSVGEQKLELTKSFEIGGQRGRRKEIAKLNLEKVNLELTDESRTLTKSVKLAFYQVVLVQEKLKLAQEIIKHNQQMFDIAQFQFTAGDISVTQVGLANIQLQSARRELAKLENGHQLAQLELNGLMGTPLDMKPTASGELPVKISIKLDLEKLKSHALTHRAKLKSLRLNLQMTESTHRLAKAANIPDVSIGGIVERNPDETGFGVILSIPLPIFDRNRAVVNASKAQKQEDTAQVRYLERQIVREVMAAFISVGAAQKNLKFYESDLLKLLSENLNLTRSAYELGEVELLEMILIQNEFVKTRLDYLDTLYVYQKAFIDLEAAISTSIELVE